MRYIVYVLLLSVFVAILLSGCVDRCTVDNWYYYSNCMIVEPAPTPAPFISPLAAPVDSGNVTTYGVEYQEFCTWMGCKYFFDIVEK